MDQIGSLADYKVQSTASLGNAQRRLLDIRSSSQQVRDTVVELQSKTGSSRVTRMELQVELEKERYLVYNVYKLVSLFLQMFLVHSVVDLFVLLLLGFPKKD